MFLTILIGNEFSIKCIINKVYQICNLLIKTYRSVIDVLYIYLFVCISFNLLN